MKLIVSCSPSFIKIKYIMVEIINHKISTVVISDLFPVQNERFDKSQDIKCFFYWPSIIFIGPD